MPDTKLGAVEMQFAEIIWTNAPLSSGTLVKLCAEQLGWKKSTTYTVLKKLCIRGLFRNEGGIVTSAVSRGEYDAAQSAQFVEENFSGSLPAFFAAFTKKKALSRSEIDEIRAIIDSMGGD
jgi:predicted transcriptional regulator